MLLAFSFNNNFFAAGFCEHFLCNNYVLMKAFVTLL